MHISNRARRSVSADIIPLPKNNNNIIGHGGHPIGIQRQQNGYRVKMLIVLWVDVILNNGYINQQIQVDVDI